MRHEQGWLQVFGRRGADTASAQLRLWDTRCQVEPGRRSKANLARMGYDDLI
jgi:hypothetical protein